MSCTVYTVHCTHCTTCLLKLIIRISEAQSIKHRHDSPANKLNDNMKQTFVNSLSKVQCVVFFCSNCSCCDRRWLT